MKYKEYKEYNKKLKEFKNKYKPYKKYVKFALKEYITSTFKEKNTKYEFLNSAAESYTSSEKPTLSNEEKEKIIKDFENNFFPFKFDDDDIYPTYVNFYIENPNKFDVKFTGDISYNFYFKYSPNNKFYSCNLSTEMSCLGDYHGGDFLTKEDVSIIFWYCSCPLTLIQDDMLNNYYEWTIDRSDPYGLCKQKIFDIKKYPLVKNIENYAKIQANIQFTNFLNSKCDKSVIAKSFEDIYDDIMKKELSNYMKVAYDVNNIKDSIKSSMPLNRLIKYFKKLMHPPARGISPYCLMKPFI